ncbi:MAG: hybrid sensor histidine kinase/response regulator [Chitinophagales bacterium]|nr:hybrid sensor histidine kinase/response regulator [Chitinophagaceae bacterium]MCB9065621.1 hybrid sensor histidine kinase/response regulator [Chitinophagales bacterium]
MDSKKKIKVLYVDDESNNLISFKASFRFDYNVLLANNTDEALKHLEANSDISVILSDQKMPDMTGVEFFEKIRPQYPNPIRILITGYTDIESVINAINRGHVFRYIKKPWTDVDVQSAIDEAHKFYVTTSMLALKNDELQKAYNELDKFAYSATHDMRGPILSVLGIIDLAKNADDIEDIKEMIEMMENAMLKLDNYIQNLHDHYSIRRGELNITEIDFNDIMKDMSDLYDITSKLKNVSFDKSVSQEGKFRSDDISIKIIVNNLLSNAFKYQRKNTDEKNVKLDMKVSNGAAVIVVEDNGIGIPESSLDQVFTMFFRGSNDEIGSGFGLYNVKDALNKINGKIEVQSKENSGTTFKVIIPSK